MDVRLTDNVIEIYFNNNRINKRRHRYRKQAELEQPVARIEDINYEAGRTLDHIVYDAYELHIGTVDSEHDISMREVYGLKHQD